MCLDGRCYYGYCVWICCVLVLCEDIVDGYLVIEISGKVNCFYLEWMVDDLFNWFEERFYMVFLLSK